MLCIGLGTGGAHVAIELAKCGVGRFILVDQDGYQWEMSCDIQVEFRMSVVEGECRS